MTIRNKKLDINVELIDHMLRYFQYRPLLDYLTKETSIQHTHLQNSIQLAQAILDIDLRQIEYLAPKLNRQYLLTPRFIERRVYSYAHYMNVQYDRQEYMDYIRAISPLLVDLLRLIIERDFMADLNSYIEPIVKENVDGKPIYRGLQWKQTVVESSDNKVNQNFTKYNGDRYNYKHYVRSSHLIKLNDDHSKNEEVKAKAIMLRHIEKFLRNIVAHEVIHVDDALVERRTGMSIEQIHRLLQESLILAGLEDKRQWQILNDINNTIHQIIIEIN